MPNNTDKPTMSVTEAANFLGISAPTMYSITERSDFSALIRVGRRKLVLRSKLLEWLETQATQAQELNEGTVK
ncbi:MAG: helix-turn-helix domain-containing protein [Defluviitaleaceae bacterium]|nr:helix-turn-helix domain-containing protein [Defluviitaleaceae bacterium]